MAPPADKLARRDADIKLTASDPLKDRNFVSLVVGLSVAALVFLVLIGLILYLYRDNSPLAKRLRRKKEAQRDREAATEETNFDSRTTNDSRQRLYPKASIETSERDAKRLGSGSTDVSVLPLSRLIPFQLSPPTAPLESPGDSQSHPAACWLSPPARDVASPALTTLQLPVARRSAILIAKRPTDSWGDFAPTRRNLLVRSLESFREYSWLLDIIHDHATGLFRHDRISGPYRLARVMEETTTVSMTASVQTASGVP